MSTLIVLPGPIIPYIGLTTNRRGAVVLILYAAFKLVELLPISKVAC